MEKKVQYICNGAQRKSERVEQIEEEDSVVCKKMENEHTNSRAGVVVLEKIGLQRVKAGSSKAVERFDARGVCGVNRVARRGQEADHGDTYSSHFQQKKKYGQ